MMSISLIILCVIGGLVIVGIGGIIAVVIALSEAR